ncbi:MAG: hypothetical protein ABIJ08_00930, partial [Nanoarchaeota archaeon]
MPEADFQENRQRLEEMIAIKRWSGIHMCEEAIRLATPIFVPWMEKLINEQIIFASIENMFSHYDPRLDFETAHQLSQHGPLYTRVVVTHTRNKRTIQSDFTDWVIESIRDKQLEDRIALLPDSQEEFYRYIIRRHLPTLLNFGYSNMENKFTFYSIENLIRNFDLKTNTLLGKEIGPLAIIYNWHYRQKQKPSSLKKLLKSAITDRELKKRLQNYPGDYEDFVKYTFNKNIELIIQRFKQVSELHQKVKHRAPTFQYLMGHVGLDKEYMSDQDLNDTSYDGTLKNIYYRISSGRGGVLDTMDWFLGIIKDHKKREEFRQIVSSIRVKVRDRKIPLRSQLHPLAVAYAESCETAASAGDLIAVTTFFTSDQGRKDIYHSAMSQKRPGESLIEAIARQVDDLALAKRLTALPRFGSFSLDAHTISLNQNIDLYVARAWESINNDLTPLRLQSFFRTYVDNGNSILAFFDARFRGTPMDEIITAHLTPENKAKIRPIPQTLPDMYRYFINKYILTYVQWAPESIKGSPNGTFTLQKFFSDTDPNLHFSKADVGGRSGPLFKMITYFNQNIRNKDNPDFEEWAMSQIEDPVVMGWVRAVPKTGAQKWGFQISQMIDKYGDYAAHNIFYKLHFAKGRVSAKLTPDKLISKTDFSQPLDGRNVYSKDPQGGTYGRCYRFYFKHNQGRKETDQSTLDFTDWLVSNLWPEKRERFLTTAQHMTSSDPDIQEQAYKTYYPKYLDLCAHHQLPRSQILAPNDFVQKIF